MQEHKAIDAIGVVAVSLITIFGLSFLLKAGIEDAAKIERQPSRRRLA